MAAKKYTFLFTLADGTTHSIPIEIPTGEDGGYYLPKITQVSESEIEITFVPSVAGMPAVDSVRLKLQDSGGNFAYVVQDIEPEDTSVLWIDPTDDSDDGFQKAVDTALAQAKESGLFDGPPGEKGEKGDSGDNYVLTPDDMTEIAEIAADLVPVPEGGGISVTGATVGQTVKIASVDENGVPTAWESVDFPSGGSGGEKPYELIIDSTIPENCERVIFREDINGNEFEITDFVVWFDGYGGSNLSTLLIFLRTHYGYREDNSAQYNYFGPLANISCRADFNFAVKATKLATKEWHVLYPPKGDSQSLTSNVWVQFTQSESIKQIAFFVSNASSGEEYRIVSGTRIMVWGRRV